MGVEWLIAGGTAVSMAVCIALLALKPRQGASRVLEKVSKRHAALRGRGRAGTRFHDRHFQRVEQERRRATKSRKGNEEWLDEWMDNDPAFERYIGNIWYTPFDD